MSKKVGLQMRLHAGRTAVGGLLCFTMLASTAGTAFGAGQTAAEAERDLRRTLGDERDLRTIEVDITGTEVTLTGSVPTFWAKSQAIKKALEVKGVETVVSKLEIPAGEDDNELARAVSEAVLNYSHYTMWDVIGAGVARGVVTLTGSVTPDYAKADDLVERVAKIRGVQDVRNMIETQPLSNFDAGIRNALATRIFNSTYFGEYASWPIPPFHVIVQNGSVRLIGVVRSTVEKRALEQIVSHTMGVSRVVNDLQTNQ